MEKLKQMHIIDKFYLTQATPIGPHMDTLRFDLQRFRILLIFNDAKIYKCSSIPRDQLVSKGASEAY